MRDNIAIKLYPAQKAAWTEERTTLVANMSILYKTAKAEIERKTEEIRELKLKALD